MQEETERVEVKDFSFNNLRRFRVFPSPESSPSNQSIFDGTTSYRLLAISNTYGLIFTAWPGQNGLKVIPTAEIHRYLDEKPKASDAELIDYNNATIELDRSVLSSPIVRLHCNSDGSVLAVCYDQPTPIAHIYDTRALAPNFPGPKPIAPFCRIRLDDVDQCRVIDFEWNPTTPDVFAACCSSGTVVTIHVNMNQSNSFGVLGSIKPTADGKATCVSWSPKGKQLAIGFENGTICQYKPQNLQMVKRWASNTPAASTMLNRLLDICWLSTNQFAMVSTGGRGGPQGDQLFLIHLTLPKESSAAQGNLIYSNYEDVCYGSAGNGTNRWAPPRYSMQHVQEWAALLCSSTASMETAVLAWKAEVKKWQVWDLDDNSRCNLPLTTVKSDETYPAGIQIDRTAARPMEIRNTDGEVIQILPPPPILLILSSDGALCPYRMVNRMSDANLCLPARAIENWNDVKLGTILAPPPAAAITPQHPSEAATQPKSSIAGGIQQPNQALPSTGNSDVSVSFTMPLPKSSADQQRKQAIVGGQSPAIGGQQSANGQAAAPTTSAERSIENEKTRLLRMEVMKWASDFDKELKRVKSKLTEPISLPGSRDQLAEKFQKLQSMEELTVELKNVIETEKSDSDMLRTTVCGHLVRGDQSRLLDERRRSNEFRTLLRYRPLTGSQEESMQSMRARLRETRETLDELIERMERLKVEKQHRTPATMSSSSPWNYRTGGLVDSPAMSSGQKKNSMDMIYRTLTNMQAIVVQQKQRLEVTKRNRVAGAMASKRSPRRDRASAAGNRYGLDESFDQLAESLEDTRIDDSSDSLLEELLKRPTTDTMVKTPYRMNDTLRRLLEKRDSTPRKTTVPVLKPPKFVYLKRETVASSSAPSTTATTSSVHPKKHSKKAVTSTPSTIPITTAPSALSALLASGPIGSQASTPPPQFAVGQQKKEPMVTPMKQTTTATGSPSVLPKAPPPQPPPQMTTVPKFQAAPPNATAPPPAKQGSTLPLFGLGSTVGMPLFGSGPTAMAAGAKATPATSIFGGGSTAATSATPLFGNGPTVVPTAPSAPFLGFGSTATKTAPLGSVSAAPTSGTVPFAAAAPARPVAKQLFQLDSASAPAIQPTSTTTIPAVSTTSTLAQSIKTTAHDQPPAASTIQSTAPFAAPVAAQSAIQPPVQQPSTAAIPAPPPSILPSLTTAPPAIPTSTTTQPAPTSAVPPATIPVAVPASTTDQPAASTAVQQPVPTAVPAAPLASIPAIPTPAPVQSAAIQPVQTREEEMEAAPMAPVVAASSPPSGFSFLSAANSPPTAVASSPPPTVGTGGIFGGGGGGGFFSGLGGRPDPEAAKRNVFGFNLGSPLSKPTNEAEVKTLFGSTAAKVATSPAAPTAFGSFGGASGGVGQQGFGALGSPSSPSGGFGGGAAFGSKPAFGGGSIFGGSPSFGTVGGGSTGGTSGIFGGSPAFGAQPASMMGSPPPGVSNTGFGSFGGGLSGQSGTAGGGSGFAAFAQKPLPTFGALAGSPTPAPPAAGSPFGGGGGGATFGGASGFGGGSPFGGGASPFGGGAAPMAATGGSPFGGGAGFGSFGQMAAQPQQQQQQSIFGGGQQQQPSSFSQWR